MNRDKRIEAVLFDLDGTLLDTYRIILESMQHAVCRVLEKDIPAERLMKKVGQPLAVQMQDFTTDEVIQQELLRVYRAYNEGIHDQSVRAFDGVPETLEALVESGVRLGIVTSKRHDPAVRGLELCGIAQPFEFVIGADDWPTHKPDPGPVAHGVELLGLDAAACLYVGDSPYDIQAGKGAGCTSVAALWGMFSREILAAEQPDHESDDIRDVLEILGRS